MKRSKQTVVQTINVSPSQAWEVIGAVSGVENWLQPLITNSRVEGNQRICSTETGDFIENILGVDHENKVFDYEIPRQHLMPVENIVGQMRVHGTQEGKAKVEWNWNFDVEESNEDEALQMLEMSGKIGIQGIENLVLSEN